MPVSASQHRTLIGAYRNKLPHFSRSNATSTQSIKPSHSAIPDKTPRFRSRICRAFNSDEELCRLSSQKTVSPPGIAVPLLKLLSQIRLAGSQLTAISENPAFVSNKDISLQFSDDTDHPDNNENIFRTILYPVANALYEGR